MVLTVFLSDQEGTGTINPPPLKLYPEAPHYSIRVNVNSCFPFIKDFFNQKYVFLMFYPFHFTTKNISTHGNIVKVLLGTLPFSIEGKFGGFTFEVLHKNECCPFANEL